MLKKIAALIKFLLTAAVWTAAFLLMARYLLIFVWHFDIFYPAQWDVVRGYWNSNGVIMGAADYMFFITLLVLAVVWLFGLRYFYKMKYSRLVLAPLEYIADYPLKKYQNTDSHVVIKNISVGEKLKLEDIIQERIKKEKPKTTRESDNLRDSISEKIIRRKGQ